MFVHDVLPGLLNKMRLRMSDGGDIQSDYPPNCYTPWFAPGPVSFATVTSNQQKITTLKEIKKSVSDIINISPEVGIHSKKGGIEFNLLNFTDGKVRIVGAHVEDTRYPEGSYERICRHAFIHLAFPLENQTSPHIGLIIDNMMENHAAKNSKLVAQWAIFDHDKSEKIIGGRPTRW